MKRYYTAPEVDLMILAGNLMDSFSVSIQDEDDDNTITYAPAKK